jgi:hypothetical protein
MIPAALRADAKRLARQTLHKRCSAPPTKTKAYKAMMVPLVEEHRPLLEELGYDPDEDWGLCAFLVYHWVKDE